MMTILQIMTHPEWQPANKHRHVVCSFNTNKHINRVTDQLDKVGGNGYCPVRREWSFHSNSSFFS